VVRLGTRTWASVGDHASDAPEAPEVNFGMIALTDCSPIVVAHEKGLFRKYGINSKVTKGANWAAIATILLVGSISGHAHAHRDAAGVDDGTAGLAKEAGGHSGLMNRNGQAITSRPSGRAGWWRPEGAETLRRPGQQTRVSR